MEMKKRSSVARSKRLDSNSGWWWRGSLERPRKPSTAPVAPPSTPHSNMIGTNAGQLKNGLPLITSG